MKFFNFVVAWSFFFSLVCLWVLHFIRNDEVSKISSDINEIRATIAQQPQECHRYSFDTLNSVAGKCTLFVTGPIYVRQ